MNSPATPFFVQLYEGHITQKKFQCPYFIVESPCVQLSLEYGIFLPSMLMFTSCLTAFQHCQLRPQDMDAIYGIQTFFTICWRQNILFSYTLREIIRNHYNRGNYTLVIARRGETTHSGVHVNNTRLSMISPDYNMILAISVRINQNSAY